MMKNQINFRCKLDSKINSINNDGLPHLYFLSIPFKDVFSHRQTIFYSLMCYFFEMMIFGSDAESEL